MLLFLGNDFLGWSASAPQLHPIWNRARITLIGIVGILSLARLAASGDWKRPVPVPVMLWPLASLALLSLLWTESLSATLRMEGYFLLTLLALVTIAQQVRSIDDTLMPLLVAGGTVVALSIGVAVLFPTVGVAHDFQHAGLWRGVYAQKNVAGRAASAVVLIAASALLRSRHRRFAIVVGCAAAFLTVMTGSKTAMGTLIVTALLCGSIAILGRSKAMVKGVTLGAGLILAAGIGFALAQFEAFGRFDFTLTGRSGVWVAALNAIGEKPLLGYGLGAFWKTTASESFTSAAYGYIAPHAHNGYIDLTLSLGFIGLVLGLAVIAEVFGRTFLARRYVNLWPIGALLTFSTIHNFAESGLFSDDSIVSFILLFCTIFCRVQADPINSEIERRKAVLR